MQNIFDDQTSLNEDTERFTTLFQNQTITIEHIRSRLSHSGEWYDQEHEEWVLLISGAAAVELENQTFLLRAGDYFHIPARQQHRVLHTSEDAHWITVHIQPL